MQEIRYKDLIGKYITQIKEDKHYIYFITKDNEVMRIKKFISYCICNVGEYIDEISEGGVCFGTITNIEVDIKGNQNNYFDLDEEIVYRGIVTFFFEAGRLNMNVHGEDNGSYEVSFKMPIEIIDRNKREEF